MTLTYIKSYEAYQTLINNSDQLIVIDFFATWCGPCKQIAPRFVELSEKYKDIIFCKVDIDEVAKLGELCEVECLPTFIFIKNKKIINKIEGANIEGVASFIDELVELSKSFEE